MFPLVFRQTSANMLKTQKVQLEPDADIKEALEVLLRLCSKKDVLIMGMMMRVEGPDPSFVTIMGNQHERGYAAADLFREFASIVDDAVDQGRVVVGYVSRPN